MAKALLATLAVLLCGTARAAQVRLAVVEVHTPPNMMGLGQQVTRAVQGHAQAAGLRVLAPDDVRGALGPVVYDELRECGPDLRCAQLRAARLPADRLVWGSLARDEKSYLVKLWLVDLRAGKLVADVDRAVLIASRRFQPTVDELIPRLLRGEREPRGTLRLSLNEPSARLRVDGNVVSSPPLAGPPGRLELELPPGAHHVQVDKPGYLPMERMVHLEAGKTTEAELRLLAAPGSQTPLAEIPQRPAQPQPGVEAAADGGLPTGAWVAFGAAAVAGTGGALLGLSARSLESELEDGFDAEGNRYTGTREAALRGRERARMANVLFGVAGAAAITGGVWWWLSREEPAVSVGAQPGAAELRVSGQF